MESQNVTSDINVWEPRSKQTFSIIGALVFGFLLWSASLPTEVDPKMGTRLGTSFLIWRVLCGVGGVYLLGMGVIRGFRLFKRLPIIVISDVGLRLPQILGYDELLPWSEIKAVSIKSEYVNTGAYTVPIKYFVVWLHRPHEFKGPLLSRVVGEEWIPKFMEKLLSFGSSAKIEGNSTWGESPHFKIQTSRLPSREKLLNNFESFPVMIVKDDSLP